MIRNWLIVALTLLPAEAFALTLQCNHYQALGEPSIKLEETQDEFIVTTNIAKESYTKTVVKSFGVLMDAGYIMRGDKGEVHIFRHDAISGINIIIADSIIFTPKCSGAGLDGPNATLEPEHLWFLSKKAHP